MRFKNILSLLVGILMVLSSVGTVFASGGGSEDECQDRYSVRTSSHDNGNGNGNGNENGNGNDNEGNDNDDNDNEGNENEGGDCEETPEPTEPSTFTAVPPTATVVIIPTNTFLPPTATLEPTATSTKSPEVTLTSDPTTVSPTLTAVTQTVVDSGDQSSNDAERYKAPVTGSGGSLATSMLFLLLGLGLIVYGLFPSLKLVKSS